MTLPVRRPGGPPGRARSGGLGTRSDRGRRCDDVSKLLGSKPLERGFQLGLEVGVPLTLEGDLGGARFAGGASRRLREGGVDRLVGVRASGRGFGPRARGRCG